jgi:hypothetical protein
VGSFNGKRINPKPSFLLEHNNLNSFILSFRFCPCRTLFDAVTLPASFGLVPKVPGGKPFTGNSVA